MWHLKKTQYQLNLPGAQSFSPGSSKSIHLPLGAIPQIAVAISINMVIAVSYHTDTINSNSVSPSYSNHIDLLMYRVCREMRSLETFQKKK